MEHFMKRILISVVLGISSVVSLSVASEFPTASEIKAISIEATKKLETELFNSEKGKKAYSEIMNILESKIKKLASEGVYNVLIINYLNSEKVGCDKFLKSLSDKEQILLKEIIVEDLIKKGYGITKNEYYNNSNSLYISISW